MARANSAEVKEPKRTPRGEARAEAQRERILAAAQECFVAHGFHAASMASISETAHMSPGLIYRYFDSKSEIILAIIERQLQEARRSIAALTSGTDLVALISDFLNQGRSGVVDVFNPVLFLEISALATRDPQIASALANSDQVLCAGLDEWLRNSVSRQGQPLDPQEIQRRRLALQCFIEGLIVRTVRNPEVELSVLVESLAQFLGRLTLPPDSPADM